MKKVSEKKKTRVAIQLLGGGVTGAFFHFGVLAALDDYLSRKVQDAEILVGVSAGSLVASTMAMGLKPSELVEAIMKDDRETFTIRREDIYRFSVADWSLEVAKFFWTFFYICFLKVQSSQEAPSFFWGLKDSLPSGLFSLRYYESWCRKFFETNERPCFFSQLDKELYIPAHELDSTKRVIFGSPGWKHIPIYKAIPASSAIPIFFKPVQIEDRFYTDGGLGSMAHLDISAGAGADLIFLVNPMVPVDNSNERVNIKTIFGERGRIKDKGFSYVYDQNLRAELRSRVHLAVHHLGYRNPEIDILMVEPETDDATMFLFNPMDFESRRQIVEYGYELTRRKIRENAELWKRTLDRHQVTLLSS